MKTLTWSHTGWFAKNFIFTMEQQIIGHLTFNRSWNSKGVYSDKETKLKFTQKNFWNRDILIIKDGKTIGEIHQSLFGETTLQLTTGEKFILSTSFWEQEVYWKNDIGETIIKYQQATMSSMAKGIISVSDSLTNETKKLLISSGIFVRQLVHRRRVIAVAVMIPIIAAASR